MSTFTAYDDAAARAILKRFERALKPLMAEVAPDWLLHHMELARDRDPKDMEGRVQIVLVCKPIGSARVVDHKADLLPGPSRLPSR